MSTAKSGTNWPQSSGAARNAQGHLESAREEAGEAFERGRSGIAQTAGKAGEDLSADVARLREDIAAIQGTLSKFASQAGGEALKSAQQMGSAMASHVGEAASEVATAAKEQAKTFASEIETMTRRNPLGAIGATLLVGVVIGMMSRGGRS